MAFEITEIWAFIAVDDDGDEGLTSFQQNNKLIPMIAADEDRVAIYMPIAKAMAKKSGKKVRLVKFTMREDVEVIEP